MASTFYKAKLHVTSLLPLPHLQFVFTIQQVLGINAAAKKNTLFRAGGDRKNFAFKHGMKHSILNKKTGMILVNLQVSIYQQREHKKLAEILYDAYLVMSLINSYVSLPKISYRMFVIFVHASLEEAMLEKVHVVMIP